MVKCSIENLYCACSRSCGNQISRNSWWHALTQQLLCLNQGPARNEVYGEPSIEEEAEDLERVVATGDGRKGVNIHIDGHPQDLPRVESSPKMKSGFLKSKDPRVSRISDTSNPQASATATNDGVDETLGTRKYTLDDFELQRVVGTGNICHVWHVVLKTRPTESFALKAIVMRKGQVKSVQQERDAMLALSDPGCDNVIKFFGTFKDEAHVYIIYEFAEGGEVWDRICYSGMIDAEEARSMILQVLDGLDYIHGRGLIHRDLKCENLLLKDGIVKIADFGSSCFLKKHKDKDKDEDKDDVTNDTTTGALPTDSTTNVSADAANGKTDTSARRASAACINTRPSREFKHFVGTPSFMPPEAISNKCSGKLRDYWSLGCLIYQMLVGRPPFYGSTDYWCFQRIRDYDLEFPPDMDADAMDLVHQLVKPEPLERLGARGGIDAIKQHAYFKPKITRSPSKQFVQNIRKSCTKIGKVILEADNDRPDKNAEEIACMIQDMEGEHCDANMDDNQLGLVERMIKHMSWFHKSTQHQLESESKIAETILKRE